MSQMMLDRRALLASLAALATPAAAQAQDYPALRAFLDGYVNSRKLAGGSIAIKRGTSAPTFISAGTLAYDTSAKVGPDSIFRIYSMTKPITGFAALKLIEEGKLSGLDQPIHEIVPAFREMRVRVSPQSEETRPAARPITLRHLVTHTSGLSYHINAGPTGALYAKNGLKPGSRETAPGPGELPPARDLETFAERLSKLPLDFDPGGRWQYAVGLDLLGLIIQRASGMPFHQYLQRSFFTPLRMPDTDFVVPRNKVARLTTLNTIEGGRYIPTDVRTNSPYARDRELPSGGGGLASTARDYIRFQSMLLGEGSLDGARVLRPETVRLGMSNLLPEGVQFRGGYGAGGQVVTAATARPGRDGVGSFSWFGVGGTQMWVDPVNRLAVNVMVQYMPWQAYQIGEEARTAAYRDVGVA